jgi:amino acid transporter
MSPLLRTLGLSDLLPLFIGSVIGSGIFLTPGLILHQLDGSVGFSLLVWLAGGILSLSQLFHTAGILSFGMFRGKVGPWIREGCNFSLAIQI